jgi:hypothetical protein
MYIFKMKGISVAILAFAAVVWASAGVYGQGTEQRRPELPAGCEALEPDSTERVAFKVYAEGFQVYSWNGSAWVLVAPDATLYANSNYRGKVGTHYGGPTWESNSGSYVKGANPVRCAPDPDSVQWLKLEASETGGSGIFAGVTHIQRVNTSGGKAPREPGAFIGDEARVPYTTEYYFYKLQGPEL